MVLEVIQITVDGRSRPIHGRIIELVLLEVFSGVTNGHSTDVQDAGIKLAPEPLYLLIRALWNAQLYGGPEVTNGGRTVYEAPGASGTDMCHFDTSICAPVDNVNLFPPGSWIVDPYNNYGTGLVTTTTWSIITATATVPPVEQPFTKSCGFHVMVNRIFLIKTMCLVPGLTWTQSAPAAMATRSKSSTLLPLRKLFADRGPFLTDYA